MYTIGKIYTIGKMYALCKKNEIKNMFSIYGSIKFMCRRRPI